MEKLLAIIVLGLLWSGSVSSEIITLHKCKKEGEKTMFLEEARNYFMIDLKNKKVTNVVTYTEEKHKADLQSAKENPDLAQQYPSLTSKTLIMEKKIYYADDNIIKAKNEVENKNWIQISNIEIDLKTYKVYDRFSYLAKRGQKVPDIFKPRNHIEDCLLKK